jgi:hypothetical protein
LYIIPSEKVTLTLQSYREELLPLIFPKEGYEEHEKTEEILADFFYVYANDNSSARQKFPRMTELYDSLIVEAE